MKCMLGFWNQTFYTQNLAPAFTSSKLANYFIPLCLTFLSCKLEKIVCNHRTYIKVIKIELIHVKNLEQEMLDIMVNW